MTEAERKPPRRNPLLDSLAAQFSVFRDCKPLAIGIHKSIQERMPEVNAGHLRVAMRNHTASTRYLKALAQAEMRFDLDGNAAGEVTAEQREQAANSLKERFAKVAERRREEAKKAAEEKREQEKAERHQVKLNQLVEKFGRR